MDSCNIFFYTLADEMGIRTLMEYAKNFGLGESTGIELPEATGNMANPDTHLQYDVDQWYDGDTVQAGIGQSDSVFTPLQLAEYCAAIANGTTISDRALREASLEAAKKNKFSSGNGVAIGTITYNFILN